MPNDSSRVYELWKKGEWDRIRKQSEEDVRVTAMVYERVKNLVR